MFVYEPQLPLRGVRTCGAAALCMVYRALGVPCVQLAVWARLSGSRHGGGARTCGLASDALSQGLAATIVQVDQPWRFLKACADMEVQVILNHRISHTSPWGHYTVLNRIDEESVWVHDPQLGPDRQLFCEELTSLWRGCWGRCEIAGNVAIVVAHRVRHADENRQTVRCSCCARLIDLDALGSPSAGDPIASFLRHVFCPHCDWRFPIHEALAPAAVVAER